MSKPWEFGEPLSKIDFENVYMISVGPRETCSGCGYDDKPAGYRNFCPACRKYPVEIQIEHAQREQNA